MIIINKRLLIAAVAMFYAVFGGLWAANHFPLEKLLNQKSIEREYSSKHGYEAWMKSDEHRKAENYSETYALTHPNIYVTLSKIERYEAILIWGSVAIGTGALALFVTRRRQGSKVEKAL